jgi:voltage-gated potassium channel
MSPWRQKVHEIIFEADTSAGKLFDILLLIAIVLSTLVVMLESVHDVQEEYGHLLIVIEWVFTILFTIEYIARIISVGQPLQYIFSFYGLVDLFSILPTYLGLFIFSSKGLSVIRTIRLLRVFRVFKLARYLKEADSLGRALMASRWRIAVFFGAVFMTCIVFGTLMYAIEGGQPRNHGEGFTSIPRSIYWAIVTLTTVGYGDISPVTPVGQAVSSFFMILGYAIIAVPTGFVSVEYSKRFITKDGEKPIVTTRSCNNCTREGHDQDAVFCKYCGSII